MLSRVFSAGARTWRARTPYFANPNRLSDLIAAIQVMGTYRFATRPLEKWEKRLGRTPVSAASWEVIFREHPEFFTMQNKLVSLVWRRSRERNYDTWSRKIVDRDEALELKQEEGPYDEENPNGEFDKKRLSRSPLDTAEVGKLIDIAISLHERGIQHRQEQRWWLTALFAIVGFIVTLASRH